MYLEPVKGINSTAIKQTYFERALVYKSPKRKERDRVCDGQSWVGITEKRELYKRGKKIILNRPINNKNSPLTY